MPSPRESSPCLTDLLTAIVADDIAAVRSLLEAHPALASVLIPEPHLYETGILHWIYAGDTALTSPPLAIGPKASNSC